MIAFGIDPDIRFSVSYIFRLGSLLAGRPFLCNPLFPANDAFRDRFYIYILNC